MVLVSIPGTGLYAATPAQDRYGWIVINSQTHELVQPQRTYRRCVAALAAAAAHAVADRTQTPVLVAH